MESTVHGLSEPDVFRRLALAAPPVLAWDAGSVGVDTGLAALHVTEDLDGICGAAQVGINPVIAYHRAREPLDDKTHTLTLGLVPQRFGSIRLIMAKVMIIVVLAKIQVMMTPHEL